MDDVPQITIRKERNGYIKIGDILIQWGSYDNGISKDGTVSIKYPQPFATRAVPIATVYKNGNTYSRSIIIANSLTGFTFRSTDNWTQGFFWQAIGY